MRCLTLADALMHKYPGLKCMFWVPEEGKDFPALRNSSYEVIYQVNYAKAVDFLVVDNYDLGSEFSQNARAWANKILVIDDLANRTHDCDILLDQTYGRDAQDYQGLVPKSANILCGTDFALLRPEFAEMRQESIKRRAGLDKVTTVLVSLGSMNLHNISSQVLETFKYVSGSFDISLVLSSQAQDLDNVRNMVRDISMNTKHTCQLLLDVTNMADLMSESDFAIGAGGTTSWERACLGLPSAVIELADNQKEIIHFLTLSEAVISLGPFNNFLPSKAGKIIENILNSQITLNKLSASSAMLCDGLGVNRVVDEMEMLFHA